MSRTIIPFQADDVSSLAKSLRAQLLARQATPGHVELLNMLARAVGRRNFQQLRAEADNPRLALEPAPAAVEGPPLDEKRLDRVLRCFGPDGRLMRWPSKREDQVLALWGLWSKLPSREDLSEREISEVIQRLHDFGDYALLRRELATSGMVARTIDGRVYRRIEQEPPREAAWLAARI